MAHKGDYASEETTIGERIGVKIFKDTFIPEPTKFVPGEVKKPNFGKTVKRSSLTEDEGSFTGKEQGFFKKFGTNKLV